MKTLNTKELLPWTNWFVYGETRSGKTEMASTFPKPFFIVPKNEQSTTTLMGQNFPYAYVTSPYGPYNEGLGEGGLLAIRDKDGNMSRPGILDTLENLFKKNPNTFPYQTIVFDAFSHYCDMIEEYLTEGSTRQMDPLRWGKMKDHIRHVHMRLRNMQCHVVFIALSQIKTNETTKVSQGMPLLSGKGAAMLPSACDVICYQERKGERFFTHFKPKGIFNAGSRLRGLPDGVEDFTFAALEEFTLEAPPAKVKTTKIMTKPTAADIKRPNVAGNRNANNNSNKR
jgi:hypothetical protein